MASTPAWFSSLLEDHRLLVLRDQHVTHARAGRVGTRARRADAGASGGTRPSRLPRDPRAGRRKGWSQRALAHRRHVRRDSACCIGVWSAMSTPVTGGDTMFADTRTAYERLAAPLQKMVRPARGRAPDLAARVLGRAVRLRARLATTRSNCSTMRRRSRRSFIRSCECIRRQVGGTCSSTPASRRTSSAWSRIESDGLLRMLYEHMTQPEFVLRHRWRPGDVVIWDNRATMHYAVDDYGTTERRVRRVTIRGDSSRRSDRCREPCRRRSVDGDSLTRGIRTRRTRCPRGRP